MHTTILKKHFFALVLVFSLGLWHHSSAQAPTITGLHATVAGIGDRITVFGSNLTVSSLYLGSLSIDGLTLIQNSDNEFSFLVPTVAVGMYDLHLTTPGGNVSISNALQVTVDGVSLPSPSISGISPTVAGIGQRISVSGTNLTVTAFFIGTTSVSLSSLESDQNSFFSLTIPAISAGTYSLTVSTPGGSFTLPNTLLVTVTAPVVAPKTPAISNVAQSSLQVDDIQTLKGVHLDSLIELKVGTYALHVDSLISKSDTLIDFSVPLVNQIGYYPIFVRTKAGTVSSVGFSIVGLNVPSISSVAPTSGIEGQRVEVFGDRFMSITGVQFGSKNADLSTLQDQSISKFSILVPGGLLPGANDVIVYTRRGVSNTGSFTLIQSGPTITGFAPDSAKVGDLVTIFGFQLNTVNRVVIGAGTTTGIRVIDSQNLTFVLPNKASNGFIRVLSPYGEYTSASELRIYVVAGVDDFVDLQSVKVSNPFDLEIMLFNTPVCTFSLKDTQGRAVMQGTSYMGKIPTHSVPPGIYYLELFHQKYRTIYKLAKL